MWQQEVILVLTGLLRVNSFLVPSDTQISLTQSATINCRVRQRLGRESRERLIADARAFWRSVAG